MPLVSLLKLLRVGLFGLLCLGLTACGQMQAKSEDPVQKALKEQAKQSAPLASDLSLEDEYEFALDLVRLELERQHYSRAESLLHKLRKVNRDDVRLYRLLAEVYEAQQKQNMALVSWKEVNKSNDKTIDDESELARMALMNEAFSLAEGIYKTWIESDEVLQKISAFNNLGFSALLQKQYPQAKAYFEQALAIDPLNSKALNNLKLVNTLIE